MYFTSTQYVTRHMFCKQTWIHFVINMLHDTLTYIVINIWHTHKKKRWIRDPLTFSGNFIVLYTIYSLSIVVFLIYYSYYKFKKILWYQCVRYHIFSLLSFFRESRKECYINKHNEIFILNKILENKMLFVSVRKFSTC